MRKGNHGGKRTLEPVAERTEDVRAKVAEAAYYRAGRRVFIGGDPVEDWLAAEKELDGAPSNLLSAHRRRDIRPI